MKTFKEWLKSKGIKEICGGGSFVVGPVSGQHQDFQVWGAPGVVKPKKRKKKKHDKS